MDEHGLMDTEEERDKSDGLNAVTRGGVWRETEERVSRENNRGRIDKAGEKEREGKSDKQSSGLYLNGWVTGPELWMTGLLVEVTLPGLPLVRQEQEGSQLLLESGGSNLWRSRLRPSS